MITPYSHPTRYLITPDISFCMHALMLHIGQGIPGQQLLYQFIDALHQHFMALVCRHFRFRDLYPYKIGYQVQDNSQPPQYLIPSQHPCQENQQQNLLQQSQKGPNYWDIALKTLPIRLEGNLLSGIIHLQLSHCILPQGPHRARPLLHFGCSHSFNSSPPPHLHSIHQCTDGLGCCTTQDTQQ